MHGCYKKVVYLTDIIIKSDFFNNDEHKLKFYKNILGHLGNVLNHCIAKSDTFYHNYNSSACINTANPAYTYVEILCIGVSILKVKAGQDIEERAIILGRYILEHKATVRAAAKQFGISKSTVHMVVVN